MASALILLGESTVACFNWPGGQRGGTRHGSVYNSRVKGVNAPTDTAAFRTSEFDGS